MIKSSQKRGVRYRQNVFTPNVESLEPRVLLSASSDDAAFTAPLNAASGNILEVRALGFEGDEQFRVTIRGEQVGLYTASTDYQIFEYVSPTSFTADEVRIEFLNDRYEPENGIDRNLQVDYISIDGSIYETEATTTYSTGTWKPEDGITPGFRQSEVLHSNGEFSFLFGASEIVINAQGSEGFESFALELNGERVQTWTNIGTSLSEFRFTFNGAVAADDVRIVFLNDLYDPANGVDANLTVDNVVVNGITYETEASSTFSTGTWKPEDGISPGFRESETLHANGYFQFEADAPLNGEGVFRLGDSQYFTSEDGSFVIVDIVREQSSQGSVSLEYQTVDSTAVARDDYVAASGVLTFADGETSKSVTITIVDDNIEEGEEQFNFVIDNITGNASLSAPRTATITIDDDDTQIENGDGLLGEYFDNLDLTDRRNTRVDSTIDFNWGGGAPIGNIGENTFSVRWTGQIKPRYSETYTFQTTSDDGVRLWVDNRLIIDEWNIHSPRSYTGQITLEANQRYDIRLEYFDNQGGAVAQLAWSSASQNFEIIPQSVLFAANDPGVPADDLVSETVLSGIVRPTAIDWSDDGRNMLVAEREGVVSVVRNGELLNTPFIDISDIVNGVRDRGLLDIAVHPDFENTPYVYLLFTYDPPEVFDYTGLAGPDGKGNRAGRLMRVTADAATNYTTIVAGSEEVILGRNSTWENFNGFANSTSDFDEPPAGIRPDGTNIEDFIASDSESHTVGALAFGIDGNLFVSIGDGTSYNRVDPRTVRVQDIDNLSGKVLRIDPITGQGVSDNPFFNGNADANRSKVYYLGLRNPFRMTVDPLTGQLFVGDVGWTQWEEVNTGPPGANFGWPYFEGGDGTNLRTGGYQNLPEAQAFYASGQTATPPSYGLSHQADGINAIVMGDVYRGGNYPSQFEGTLFVNDLGQGIVRAVEITPDGTAGAVRFFATDAQLVVQMTLGPDGLMYFVDYNEGIIGRWSFV